MLTFMQDLNDCNQNFFYLAVDWNWVGGVGDEVPQKQKLFSCLNTDSSCFGEFQTSYTTCIIGILTY